MACKVCRPWYVVFYGDSPNDSPRDSVTISRMFSDTSTLIDVSTSLPRSPDEPIYLRPSPPYVRSEVTRERFVLLVWTF